MRAAPVTFNERHRGWSLAIVLTTLLLAGAAFGGFVGLVGARVITATLTGSP